MITNEELKEKALEIYNLMRALPNFKAVYDPYSKYNGSTARFKLKSSKIDFYMTLYLREPYEPALRFDISGDNPTIEECLSIEEVLNIPGLDQGVKQMILFNIDLFRELSCV